MIMARPKKKVLTKNAGKIDLAFEDIKRLLDTAVRRDDKIKKIEQIIENLYE